MTNSNNNSSRNNKVVDHHTDQYETNEANIVSTKTRSNQGTKTKTTKVKQVANTDISDSSDHALSEEEILSGYRDGTIIPENNGKYWTDEDRKLLATKFNNEEGITRMALDFKRKELAVMQQLVSMGLVNSSASHKGNKQKDCGCLCSKCLNFECENNPNRPRP